MVRVLLPQIDLRWWGRWLCRLWCIALGVSVYWPQIDLQVSALFWSRDGGFDYQHSRIWSILRYGAWNTQIGMFVASLVVLAVITLRGRDLWGISARMAGFVSTLFLLGPGLLVNVVFKDHGGRARPADITQFGGQATFTPPWVFADQCARNCAFPSGEVSSAVVMAVVICLATMCMGRIWRSLLRGCAVAIVVFVMAQRITDGRHFVSDVVFAVLMTGGVAWGLYALFSTPIRRR